jgi:hypothetical protein
MFALGICEDGGTTPEVREKLARFGKRSAVSPGKPTMTSAPMPAAGSIDR